MREIKFRAWNGLLHEYRTIDMNSGKQNLGMGFEATEGIGSNTTTIYHSVGDVIEQYTDLKDKNGVEIYENDIIHVQSNLYKDHIGAIIWSQGTPSFCISDNTNEFNIPRPLGMQIDGFLSYEVIGNIHENPDLLEEQ
ncbi:YopX family protein [Leuconostoc mesenteroides]|uniref:YopX family protein n=1 Tax=Leuconostoc mesenteroides TaxID=1245 RepID=UPI00235EE1CE|nr:YopX family protein [Leuconostoc mesenteroides]